MTWISVNPIGERDETVQAAMALSGQYREKWSECGEYIEPIPKPIELCFTEIAEIYNNADSLGVDIYTIAVSTENT